MNRHDLVANHEKLEREIKDTDRILEGLEGARRQLSVLGDSLEGQTTVIRQRVAWLIRECDSLRELIGKTTQPGDSR